MPKKILLTSFDVWETHHVSNSSDDLVGLAIAHNWLPPNVHVLRRLPVDGQLAPAQVIAAIHELQPDVIICCGMAENRPFLTVESNGKCDGEVLTTEIELLDLIAETMTTQISHDAGNFVCNHLYYSILRHIRATPRSHQCLFIHVPLLHENNLVDVGRDFTAIVNQLALMPNHLEMGTDKNILATRPPDPKMLLANSEGVSPSPPKSHSPSPFQRTSSH